MANHYVLICGGRDYSDPEHVLLEAVRFLAVFYGDKLRVMHGGAKGADMLAGEAAISFGVPVKVFPADWDTHGKRAGPIRNKQMLEYLLMCRRKGHSVQVVAFPGGKGTEHMVKLATEARIDVDRPGLLLPSDGPP